MTQSSLENDDAFLRRMIDAIPSMVFVVDEDLVVLHANRAAHRTLGGTPEIVLKRLCGEVLHCLHSKCPAPDERPSSCGATSHCETCVLRVSAGAAREGTRVERRPHTLLFEEGGVERVVHLEVTATTFDHRGRALSLLILEDVTSLHELRQILSICAWCRRVREGDAFRTSLEAWLARNTNLVVTHGMCEDCLRAAQSGP